MIHEVQVVLVLPLVPPVLLLCEDDHLINLVVESCGSTHDRYTRGCPLHGWVGCSMLSVDAVVTGGGSGDSSMIRSVVCYVIEDD